MATTVKDAVSPASTVWLVGLLRMLGASCGNQPPNQLVTSTTAAAGSVQLHRETGARTCINRRHAVERGAAVSQKRRFPNKVMPPLSQPTAGMCVPSEQLI